MKIEQPVGRSRIGKHPRDLGGHLGGRRQLAGLAACRSVLSGIDSQIVDASREASCQEVNGTSPSEPTVGLVGPISQ